MCRYLINVFCFLWFKAWLAKAGDVDGACVCIYMYTFNYYYYLLWHYGLLFLLYYSAIQLLIDSAQIWQFYFSNFFRIIQCYLAVNRFSAQKWQFYFSCPVPGIVIVLFIIADFRPKYGNFIFRGWLAAYGISSVRSWPVGFRPLLFHFLNCIL